MSAVVNEVTEIRERFLAQARPIVEKYRTESHASTERILADWQRNLANFDQATQQFHLVVEGLDFESSEPRVMGVPLEEGWRLLSDDPEKNPVKRLEDHLDGIRRGIEEERRREVETIAREKAERIAKEKRQADEDFWLRCAASGRTARILQHQFLKEGNLVEAARWERYFNVFVSTMNLTREDHEVDPFLENAQDGNPNGHAHSNGHEQPVASE